MLSFASDYVEGAHPAILQRFIDTNLVKQPGYGSDEYTASAKEKIKAACGCPEADVWLLTGGTQTNQVVIDSLLHSYEGVVAAETGHIAAHEAGAIEFTGHKVLTIPHHQGKVTAADVQAYLQAFYADENHSHMVYPGMLYLSHPTEYGTLYTKEEGREFLISESVRGEGAILLNHKGERFVDELLPRDVVANAIFAEMRKEGKPHMWLSLEKIPTEEILSHFPHIYQHCLEVGYDVTKEPIPVVPSQHYFMGGVDVNEHSKTSMERLYAVGETACNGVHGRNRLASNSLLESLVFAKRAAADMMSKYEKAPERVAFSVDPAAYTNYKAKYKEAVLTAIERERQSHE